MIACLHRVSEDGINAHSFHAKWFDKVPENCEKITVPPPPTIAVRSMPDGMPLPQTVSASISQTGGIIN